MFTKDSLENVKTNVGACVTNVSSVIDCRATKSLSCQNKKPFEVEKSHQVYHDEYSGFFSTSGTFFFALQL